MSADILILPVTRIERDDSRLLRPGNDNCNTERFIVEVREDIGSRIRAMAEGWGCTPEQYLAETVEDLLCVDEGGA